MTAPESKLSFAATRVVKASRELSAAEKLLWLECHALDRSADGAWIAAEGLASRLGVHPDTIKTHRTALKAIGLLTRLQQKRSGSGGGWLVWLPCECVPTERRLNPDEVEHYAEALDRYIRSRRKSGGVSPTPTTPAQSAAQGADSPPLPAQPRGNDGGDSAPTNAPPLHPSNLQVGEVGAQPPSTLGQETDFAHAKERPENGRTENSGLPGNGGPPALLSPEPHPCSDCGDPVADPARPRCAPCFAKRNREGFALIRAAVKGNGG